MARAYKPPRWQYFLMPVLVLAIYLYPLFIFLQCPERLFKITSLFYLFPALYLFFLFTPNLDSHPSPTLTKPIKPLLIILLTETVLTFMSQSIGPSLFFMTTHTHININATLTPPWLALWTFFSLFTAANHYFAHREKKSPLASATLYAFKNSYISIFLTRAISMFSALGNFFIIYLLMSLTMLYFFYLFSGTLAIGLSPFLILGFLLIFFVASILVSRFSQLIHFPFKLRNIHYLLITSLFAGIILFKFYTLSLIYAKKSGLLHTLLYVLTPAAPSSTLILLFQYSFFILAMPLASSIILCFSKTMTTKALLVWTMIPPIALFFFGTIDFSSHISTLTVIISVICIVTCTRQKTTADFFTGCLPLPKQRFIMANKSSRLIL